MSLPVSSIIISAFVQCVNCRHHFINSSATLSLPLYPYFSIVKQHPHSYAALTLSRLAADIAWLNSINSMIQHALHNNNFSGHPSSDDSKLIQPNNLGTALFSGSAIHLVRIGVGQPTKQVYLITDTGSGLTWLQCLPCTKCSKSSSYAPLPCTSEQCTTLLNYVRQCFSNEQCGFRVTYDDGSYSSGVLATKTLAFNNVPVNGVAIG